MSSATSAKSTRSQKKVTVKDVLKLARKGNSINSTMNKGIKEYRDVVPTEAEAEVILFQMIQIVELEKKQMAFAIANKPAFDKLHVAVINLKKSEESANALASIMVAKSPPSLRPQAEGLDKRAKKSFTGTVALYKGATGGEDQIDDKVDDSD